MERVTWIEHVSLGWKPKAQPLDQTRLFVGAYSGIRTRDRHIGNVSFYR